MRNVIFQSIVLPASPERLFNMYLDPDDHSAFTGAPVEIGPETGDLFNAFGGALSGVMLRTVRPSLIVQSWRSKNFGENDVDSTLVLTFASEHDQGRIDLVQVDVPDCDYQGVTKGWETNYWIPWRKYLSSDEGKQS